MTTTSAPASCASDAAAAPMPVAPPTTSTRLPSKRKASNCVTSSPFGVALSCDDAADLEVHDRVPVETELGEDRVAVLVELRRPAGRRRLLVELHRGSDELERHAPGGRALLHVAVGDRLLGGRGLESVLPPRPLPGERLHRPPPLGECGRCEHLG